MRSCSALSRNCAYQTTLSKARPRSACVMQTATEGTRFGALVQGLVEGKPEPEPEALDDPYSWYLDFLNGRGRRVIPPGALCEVAMGLGPDGSYVPVVEIYPHYYVPSHDATGAIFFLPAAGPQELLATAGRLDVAWVNGNVGVVLDCKRSAWKYGEPEFVPQLMALGAMWALRHGLEFMQTGLYGAKDGAFVWATDIQRVADVLPEVLEMAALPEDEPRAGEWCQSCYERKDCPPGKALYPITKSRR